MERKEEASVVSDAPPEKDAAVRVLKEPDMSDGLGNENKTENNNEGARVNEIHVSENAIGVSQIKFVYSNGEESVWGERLGRGTSPKGVFALSGDEYITHIMQNRGRIFPNLVMVKFVTNTGRESPSYGDEHGGCRIADIIATPSSEIFALHQDEFGVIVRIEEKPTLLNVGRLAEHSACYFQRGLAMPQIFEDVGVTEENQSEQVAGKAGLDGGSEIIADGPVQGFRHQDAVPLQTSTTSVLRATENGICFLEETCTTTNSIEAKDVIGKGEESWNYHHVKKGALAKIEAALSVTHAEDSDAVKCFQGEKLHTRDISVADVCNETDWNYDDIPWLGSPSEFDCVQMRLEEIRNSMEVDHESNSCEEGASQLVVLPHAGSADMSNASLEERSTPKKRQSRCLYDDSDSEDQDWEVLPCSAPAIQGLDLKVLADLVALAEPALQEIEDKDVVILLGKTGVGKSTLIQAIGGRRLERQRYQRTSIAGQHDGVVKRSRDEGLEKDVFVAIDALDEFAIGHDLISKTKGIKHFVPPRDEGNVVYLDSSGYEDTAGVEVDIATSVSFRKVAQKCRHLRFVVLISCASFLENRGGAIRALVKLVSSFVKDFDKHKLAFTFLFTHTDALPEAVGKDPSELKLKLQGLLADTEDGTEKDQNVKRVLKWMLACVRKDYPFVNIFHPELSDIETLVASFEKFAPEGDSDLVAFPAIGLASEEKPSEVVTCGMTAASISILTLELDRFHSMLGWMLKGNSFSELASFSSTLSYLKACIEIDELLDAFGKASELVGSHYDVLKQEAYMLIHRGTDGEEAFSETNARRALQQIAAMHALTSLEIGRCRSPNLAEEAIQYLRERVRNLGLEVRRDFQNSCRPKPNGLAERLRRLQAWSAAHGEFTPIADIAVKDVEIYIDHVLKGIVQTKDVQKLAHPLALLENFRTHVSCFESLGVRPSHNINEVCKDAATQLQDFIENSVQDSIQHLSSNEICDFSRLANGLEMLQSSLEPEEKYLSPLLKTVRYAQQRILTGLNDEFKRRSDAVKSAIEKGIADSSLQEELESFANLVDMQTPSQRVQGEGVALYKDAVKTCKRQLEEWFLELNTRCDQVASVGSVGITEPERHLFLLSKTQSCQWFDSSLESGRSFVKGRCAEVRSKYSEHFKVFAQKALDLLCEFLTDQSGCSKPFEEFSLMLARCTSFIELTEVYPHISKAHDELTDAVGNLLKAWCVEQAEILCGVPDHLLKFASFNWREVNKMVAVCKDLSSIAYARCELDCLAENAKQKVSHHSHAIQELMQTAGDYETKKSVMDSVASWSRQDLPFLVEAFPNFDSLCTSVRKDIDDQVVMIREMISKPGAQADAEMLLEALSEASILDRHLCNQVTRDVDILKQMLEMQLAGIDDAFRAEIEKCDFANVHERIKPFDDSRDPIKQQKCKEIYDAIAASVEAQISYGNDNVRSGTQVAATIKLLEQAGDHVGKLLKTHKSINVFDAADRLKSRAVKLFEEALVQFESAGKSLDFVSLLNSKHEAISYHKATKHLLGRELHARACQLMCKADSCLANIDKLVAAFVDNISKVSKERADTSELVATLSKLKLAVDNVPIGAADDEGNATLPENSEVQDTFWVVIGGFPKDGITVRSEKGLESPQCSRKLSTGAVIKQLDLDGNRLHYQLCSGTGPAFGWVSLAFKDKKLIVHADAAVWKVCGKTVNSKDIGVQVAKGQNSGKAGRLHVGAIVREVALEGDRLHFTKLAGIGPDEGWTNMICEGTDMLIPLHSKRPLPMEVLECSLTIRKISDCYENAVQKLSTELNSLHETLRKDVQEKLFISVIDIYTYMQKELDKGLREHVRHMAFDAAKELEAVRNKKLSWNEEYRNGLILPEEIDSEWLPLFDRLLANSSSWLPSGWRSKIEYDYQKQGLEGYALQTKKDAEVALKEYNYERAGSNLLVLRHVRTVLKKHLSAALAKSLTDLDSLVTKPFELLQDDCVAALTKNNIPEFETLFSRYHKFVIHLDTSCRLFMGKHEPLHKTICLHVDGSVKELFDGLKALDFPAVASLVESLRKVGHVLTGIYAVYYEDIRKSVDDKWLKRINELSNEHFGGKALSHLGAHYALLEVAPNSSWDEIHKAYKRKSREHHPDKLKLRGIIRSNPNEMQQRLEQAKDALSNENVRREYERGFSDPFTADIKKIPQDLYERAQNLLASKSYDQIKQLLNALHDLHLFSGLVDPDLEVEKIRKDIFDSIKQHINAVRADITAQWVKRDLKRVHDALTTLDCIDFNFSAYSDIYSDGWRKEISRLVEKEIDVLAQKATDKLKGSESTVESNLKDFALHLIFLGRIFDELPPFKDYAVMKINNVLESCQEQSWGFAYLFKLGIVLEQGKVGAQDTSGKVCAEDQRIGKVIVKEFRHFKDVLTLVWNQQTDVTQKDVSITVKDISSKRVRHSQDPGGRLSYVDVSVAGELLLKSFKTYESEYDKHFHSWRAGQLKLDDLAKAVIVEAKKFHPCQTSQWTQSVKDRIPHLLAGIAAYFTISKSGDSYKRLLDAGRGNGQVMTLSTDSGNTTLKTEHVLQRPHNIQILTVLRLLGCDSADTNLRKHLMQIRTGEGKSMILGMCSLLFGLLGFKVRCVCYSEYLSQRDFKLFKSMFSAFSVCDRVTYSKITTFSEDQTAAKGDIRSLTLSLLRGSPLDSGSSPLANVGPRISSTGDSAKLTDSVDPGGIVNAMTGRGSATLGGNVSNSCPSQRRIQVGLGALALPALSPEAEEILLVDEVDMVFGQDFYGQTHNQVALLEEPEVACILKSIWNQRNNAMRPMNIFQDVSNSDAYNTLLNKFPQWKYLIEGEVSSMCHDLRDFEEPPYHYDRSEDRIGYKAMDGICYDIVYRYRTAFAYLNEATNKNLRNTDSVLKRALQLRVSCGQFSYANFNADCILGVSGTVEALGEHEWCIMNRFGIDHYTKMPSVYGRSNFRFLEEPAPIIVADSRDEFFHAVTEEVSQKVREGRAAIVFFEDAADLDQFQSSPYYQRVTNKNHLRERDSLDDKEYVIKKAATAGQATFTTAVFGRGTDFFCNDMQLEKAGGVHVVQAFFASEKTEEVQIQGRTARQGKKGTYCMILEAEKLKTALDVEPELAKRTAPADLYALLEQKRQKQRESLFKNIENNLATANARDITTHSFFDALLSNAREKAMDIFKDLYTTSSKTSSKSTSANHIVFCLDESGSMQRNWDDLVAAYQGFITKRVEGHCQDVVSVVQFDDDARDTLSLASLDTARNLDLVLNGGRTQFIPALRRVKRLISMGLQLHDNLTPVLIFMSDGVNDDGPCSHVMQALSAEFPSLEVHTIFFETSFFGKEGCEELQNMAAASNGKYHLSVNGVELSETFAAIAVGAEFTAAQK